MKKTIISLAVAAALAVAFPAQAFELLTEATLPQSAYSYFETEVGVLDMSVSKQMEVATRADTPTHVLNMLSRSDSAMVRQAVMDHPNTESAMRMFLSPSPNCG